MLLLLLLLLLLLYCYYYYYYYYYYIISWLRTQLSFAILRTVHRCARGSRYPFKSREVSEYFTFASAVACLHLH